jgi:hypothetical protein
MCGGSPKVSAPPPPPPPPPEPPVAPRFVDKGVADARRQEQGNLRKMSGRASTILTNPSLMGDASTGATGKTKLG